MQCLCEGGRACTREDPAHQAAAAHAGIQGLHASWVGYWVLAMARPWQENVVKHAVVERFKEQGIGMIINLCEVRGVEGGCSAGLAARAAGRSCVHLRACSRHICPARWQPRASLTQHATHTAHADAVVQVGEHETCGPGLLASCGFTYNPEAFMAAKIGFCNFSWRDMGVPTLDKMMDIVQVRVHGGRGVGCVCRGGGSAWGQWRQVQAMQAAWAAHRLCQ